MRLRRVPGSGAFACALVLALAIGGGAAAEPAPRSGRYGSLAVVVRDGRVSGVFSDGRGGVDGMPAFHCVFLLHGTLSSLRATVETWYPGAVERIAGTLAFTAQGAALTLAEDHGGCPMATGSMVGKPVTLPRATPEAGVEPEGWRGVGLVIARRASLRPGPGPAPRRGPYLVANDPVVVLDRREGWMRVLYQGGEAGVTGWLPAADLAVAAP